MHAILLALAVLFAPPHAGDDSTPITADALEAHVRFLASDALAGRDTGSAGSLEAAAYLAKQLEDAGLQPAGDDGGFLQSVPLHKLVSHGKPSLVIQRGSDKRQFEHGDHYSVSRNAAHKTGSLRVVQVPEGGPLPEPDATLALSFADRRGAVRDMLEAAGRDHGEGYGMLLFLGSKRDGKPRGPIRRRGLSPGSPDVTEAPPWIVARGAFRDVLEAGEVTQIKFAGACELVAVEAVNVLARIPGVGTTERPELAQQAIVISAHYDHLGVISEDRDAGTGRNGEPDRIYNGADDDASGVACVLEVARALASGPPPAREVVILLATGEERGLFGTLYYLDAPVVPLERTIANLNVEMIGRADPKAGGPGYVWYTGPDETNLLAAFVAAGVPVVRDPYPEEHYYQRSDNYAFVRRGIIGQSFSTYDGHKDYHHVTDEADTLDYVHMQGATRTTLDAIRLVASGAIDPEWAEGKEPPERH